VNCKVVFYGPGMSGKTTNLEKVYENAPDQHKGELTSIATEGDRTLFFDFLPLDLGTVAGMNTKFQLYTVPGQVYYNSTRKLVLQGADGVIFVADSQRKKMDENIESLENLMENLTEYNINPDDIPIILQYNKRDLPDVLSVDELNKALNPKGWPTFEAVAVTGEGVFPTLKALSSLVLENLNKEYGVADDAGSPRLEERAPAPEPAKPEPAKPEPAKPAPAKPAPAKPEPAKPAPAKPAPRPAPLTPVKPPPKPLTAGGKAPATGGFKAPKAPLPQKQSSKTLVWVIVLILIMAVVAVVAVLFLGNPK
jgi:hypothetical protein